VGGRDDEKQTHGLSAARTEWNVRRGRSRGQGRAQLDRSAGVKLDALQSQWGMWVTLSATALLFGLGHLRGYPSGVTGACLAALFGFAMGVLRLWTGGLALPIVAHMAADATLYGILVHSGAV